MTTNINYPPNFLHLPRWTLALHVVQLFFAVVILGLDAYGLKYIPYSVLIFSLVVCLCTLFVSFYLLASRLQFHKLFNPIVALAFHIWMLLFWVVDMGLVASLAHLWSGPDCSYDPYYGTYCSYNTKRGLEGRDALGKRDTTTYTAYYGALAAGAAFAGVQLITWIISTIILILHFNKHRTNAANNAANFNLPVHNPQQNQQQQLHPPQYVPAPDNNNAIPMEKYNHTAPQQHQYQQTPTQQYAQPVQGYQQQPQQQQQQQQAYQQPPQQNFTAPYVQDPIQRQDTVSPVSHLNGQTGYTASSAPPPPMPVQNGNANGNVSELSSPQHTGQQASVYPSNVSELSVPQQQQQQVQQQSQRYDVPELASSK